MRSKDFAAAWLPFVLSNLTDSILSLRTTEDVYLMAWGSDSLTYKAEDLETIRTWTARKADWDHLFKLHHKIRPKTKGPANLPISSAKCRASTASVEPMLAKRFSWLGGSDSAQVAIQAMKTPAARNPGSQSAARPRSAACGWLGPDHASPYL